MTAAGPVGNTLTFPIHQRVAYLVVIGSAASGAGE